VERPSKTSPYGALPVKVSHRTSLIRACQRRDSCSLVIRNTPFRSPVDFRIIPVIPKTTFPIRLSIASTARRKIALPEILLRHPFEHRRLAAAFPSVRATDPVLVKPAHAAVADEHHPVRERLDRPEMLMAGAQRRNRRRDQSEESICALRGGEKRLDEGFVDPGTSITIVTYSPSDQCGEFEARRSRRNMCIAFPKYVLIVRSRGTTR